MFCLASISESLCVTTRCTDEVVGQQLWYDREGKLEDSRTTSVSRQVGCTVSLSKLFHMLPVRRADLKKRLKAQRAKLFRLLQVIGIFGHVFSFLSHLCRCTLYSFLFSFITCFGALSGIGLCYFKRGYAI